MMTVEQLAFVLEKAYPTLARWKDYWVSHPVDSHTLAQTGPAWIPAWLPTDPPKPTDEVISQLWELHGTAAVEHVMRTEMRARRDALLTDADVLVMKMEDAGKLENIAAARKYRQALRDVTELPGFPTDFTWPTVPDELVPSLPKGASVASGLA
jgi:hypothetical protein